MLKKVFLKIILFYQGFISPLFGERCRFYPSCSEYTRQSIEKYGLSKGFLKGVVRILKCNPYNGGGIDFP